MAVRKDHQNVSKWHAMTPEQKARRLATVRAWQAANKDRVRSYYKKKAKGRPPGYGDYERAKKYNYVRDAKIAIGECADCGFFCDDVSHVCFAWDHQDPLQKSFSLSKAHKYKWEEIDAELAKCELVCHNCHALRTYLEQNHRTESRHLTDDQPTLFD